MLLLLYLLMHAALLQQHGVQGESPAVLLFLVNVVATGGLSGAKSSADAVTARYIWSVTPCLLAWPAVALPPGPGSLLAASTLGLAYAVDRQFAAKGLLPPWSGPAFVFLL